MDGDPPVDGLAAALTTVRLHSNHRKWANETLGRDWADADQGAAEDMGHLFDIHHVLRPVPRPVRS